MKALNIKTLQSLLRKHSPFWSQQIERYPEDLSWLKEANLTNPRSTRAYIGEWKSKEWETLSSAEVFQKLREAKRREMLRITVRDLMNLTSLPETVAELSALADFCLQQALKPILKEMNSKWGTPESQFTIFGMGKLGGQELNYSSDIDLIFVYSGEGNVGTITHHEFYKRVSEKLIEGFRSNDDGSLFRVDLRLRPEGNSGPIVRSIESYENYYAGFGEVWERMALQKARCVAGDEELGYEFNQHLQPFCFPKHLPPNALDEIFEIKERIENEIVKEGTLERHVKLGRGGIREIEFSVQALQLLYGARHAFSQERGTLKSLQALHRLELLSAADTAALTRAYVFLRRLEHRLQMQEDRQTHTVPDDKEAQKALAEGLGFKSHQAFEKEWKSHIDFVRGFFHGIVRPDGATQKTTTIPLEWDVQSEFCVKTVKEAGFDDAEKAIQTFRTLSLGPEYAHVSQRTRKMFEQLAPYILKLTPSLARPDQVLQQLERFIESYGSRASLYELLTSNPKMLELLFKLFDRSRFLADLILHQSTLIDSIAFDGLLLRTHNRERMKTDLAKETGATFPDRLRRFRNAELLRIGLRDILGLSTSMEETWGEISLLADVCLEESIASLQKPKKGKKTEADSFCVIALGKYGGQELGYGSDLDVIFVGGTPQMASELIQLMSQERSDGIVFKVDARLRPDGEDGPLTLPLKGYETYYVKRAQFWEKQALTRVRFVGGDKKMGDQFLKLVDKIIYSRAVSKAELKEMDAMRLRIEKERGDQEDPIRDFKTGAGGLVDVEFLAQRQQLIWGHKYPEVRRGSTIDILRTMTKLAKWNEKEAKELIENHLWLRNLESVLRCLDNAAVSELPSERSEWRDIAECMGLADEKEFEKELTKRRKNLRNLVKKFQA
jgi:[glutamine synthetase] adenylyltransferase / [glutamine synthetase]-adenylyl-L-tyrosine phosphorylase